MLDKKFENSQLELCISVQAFGCLKGWGLTNQLNSLTYNWSVYTDIQKLSHTSFLPTIHALWEQSPTHENDCVQYKDM